MKKIIYTILAASCFVTAAQAQDQRVIGLSFIRLSSGAGLMSSTDVAGVIPVANWNTATAENAHSESVGIDLVFDSGEESGALATWQTGNASWSVPTAGAGSEGDKIMMTGYLDQAGNGLNQIHEVMVTDIPFDEYSILLYHSSSGGANRTARYEANGIELFTRNLDPQNTFDEFILDQHGTLEESNASPTGGNYVAWSELSGDLTIFAQGIGLDDGGHDLGGNVRRAPIQGIQIVGTIFDPIGCDFDGNSTCDLGDIDSLIAEIASGANNPSFDLTGDGSVNLDDRDRWLADAATENGFAGPYFLGDANIDGSVNASDLNDLGISWQTAASAWSQGDFTANGLVDAQDLNALGINWLQSTPVAAMTVPEPSSAILLLGAGLLFCCHRRKTSRLP